VPVIAPILGGYMHVWFGWRANFVVVTLCAAVILVTIIRVLPETNLNLQNQSGLWRSMASGFGTLLSSKRYIGYTMGMSSCGICFYGFVTAAPVILIDRFGLPTEMFGIYTSLLSVGYLAGSALSHRLASRVALGRLIFYGGLQFAAAGVIGVALLPVPEAWTVIAPLFLIGVSSGMVMPVSQAGGVSAYPQLAGAASGLGAFIQNMASALITIVMAAIVIETALPLAAIYLVAGGLSLFGAVLIGRD
jgi:DHA1 family bicyclomycin/chloramphenicol resistance-like MFS transporter